MTRSLFSKLVRLGRTRVAAVLLALVLVVGLATTAGAHTGYAGLVHRNHSNPISAVTTLVGSVAGSVLGITNNNTAATNGSATAVTATNNNATSPTVRATNNAGGTALDLATTCRIGPACFKAPPMTVNSDTKVANLNADKIDGLDATDFVGDSEKAADSNQLDGIDSTGFVQGMGETIHGAAIVPASQGAVLYNKEFMISFQCGGSGNGAVHFENNGPYPLHLFTDHLNGTNPVYDLLPEDVGSVTWVTSVGTEHMVFGAYSYGAFGYDGFVATVEFFKVGTANGCPVYVQGSLTREP